MANDHLWVGGVVCITHGVTTFVYTFLPTFESNGTSAYYNSTTSEVTAGVK